MFGGYIQLSNGNPDVLGCMDSASCLSDNLC